MLYDKINTKVYVYRRADQNVIRMNFTKSCKSKSQFRESCHRFVAGYH